ncbi:hypothetical protein CPB97_003440 [Podila verticillata]|nr:hypothetical protein CPB97_003440 [Podila verticillata]
MFCTTKASQIPRDGLSPSSLCRLVYKGPSKFYTSEECKGISMIDGEKQGMESSRHRDRSRVTNLESTTARKRSGAKLDLIAHDSVNKRDWFVVESPKEWDEQSTKFLAELNVKVFRNLHLIAAHRLAELRNTEFRREARFFSLYAGGT